MNYGKYSIEHVEKGAQLVESADKWLVNLQREREGAPADCVRLDRRTRDPGMVATRRKLQAADYERLASRHGMAFDCEPECLQIGRLKEKVALAAREAYSRRAGAIKVPKARRIAVEHREIIAGFNLLLCDIIR